MMPQRAPAQAEPAPAQAGGKQSAGQASDGLGRTGTLTAARLSPGHSGGVAPSPRSTSPQAVQDSISLRLRADLEEVRILAAAMQVTGRRMQSLAEDALRAFDAWQLAAAEVEREQARLVEARISAAHVLAGAAAREKATGGEGR